MDFEYDALKAAHRTAALIKDPRGKPMNINLDTLVVTRGYTNAFRAKEILRTLQKGNQPSTADRESGGVPDFKIIELPPFTTNTDYWFIKIKKALKMLYRTVNLKFSLINGESLIYSR